MRVPGLAVISASLLLAGGLRSQSPQFEVASIKPSSPGNGGSVSPGGTTFRASGLPLIGLIGFAWNDIRPDRIDGAPRWAFSDRWDIVAKVANPSEHRADLERQRLMLQQLLADRFRLKIHHESRERQVYVLLVDKNGSKMRENNDLTSAPAPLIRISRRGQAVAQIVSMTYMAQFLTSQVGELVVDQTGLTGNYDFTLEWNPEQNPAEAQAAGPSIFTALREQLGLQLKAARAPVDYIVIDGVEKPKAD